MSEANREILSAGMDGELSREEIRFLLRRLETDSGLADAWARYHVGRDGLRHEVTPAVSGDFASRVMAAIEAESASVGVAAPRRRWLQWSAGGAIAASVAVAALMLTQPAGTPTATRDVAVHAPVAGEADVADATPVAPVAPQWLSGNTASQFTQKAAYDGSNEAGTAYLPRSMPYQLHGVRAAEASENNGYMFLPRSDVRYAQPAAASQAH